MGVLFTAAVLLVLMNVLVAGSHCRTYSATNINNCGNMPAATNPRTVSWTSGGGFYVNRAYLEVWRVANIRSQQTGCLNAVEVAALHASSSSSYSLSSVDYNSLYIAKVRWLDSSNNPHYLNNSECYFIPQRPSPPQPTVSISSRYLTARSVTLSLSLCTSGSGYGSLKYVIRYSSPTGQKLIAETTGSTLTIEHLLPDRRYTFTVTCTNTVGVSGSSVSVSATTKSEGTLQPRIFSVVIDNSLAFTDISWTAPSAVDLVSGYDVQVVPHVGGIPQSPSVYLMATSSRYNTSYRVIWSFTPETLYMFQVRARTSVGTSQWSTPVVRGTLPAVPNEVNGFSLDSSLSTTISMLWNGSNATVDYYMLTLHNLEANATEHYQLFHTVNSHTFHNLRPNTAYSVTITTVNKAGSGPTVSVNVSTQGAPAQPLAVTTGIFGTVVFIGVAGFLLIGGAWCGGRHIIPKLRSLIISRRKDGDCNIEEGTAYAIAHGDRLQSQGFFCHKKEGVGKEEDQGGSEGEGQGTYT